MKITHFVFIALLAFLAIGCSQDNPKDNPILQDAFSLHKEAIAVHDALMPEFEKWTELETALENEITRMNVAAEALDTVRMGELDAAKRQLAEAKANMKTWMENLAEVPGFEDEDHGHDHGDGHDHDHHHHGDEAKLTPEQVKEVQQAQLEAIQQLQGTAVAAVTRAEELLSAGEAPLEEQM